MSREHTFRAQHNSKWYYFSLRDLVVASEGEYYWLDDPHTPLHEMTSIGGVYEGDIVLVALEGKEPDVGWIVWDTSAGSWRIQSFSWWCYLNQPERIEVLGNIVDNHDLLQKR